MTRLGVAVAVVAVTGLLAACGAEGGVDDAGSKASASTSSTTSGGPATTTTTDAAKTEAIPWSDVVAVTEARSGQVDKVMGAMWDDTDEFVEGGRLEESISFDQDRAVIERTMSFDTSAAGVPAGPIRFIYAGDQTFLSAPWVEEQCGTAWVPMGEALGDVLDDAGVADAFDTEILFPLDPLGSIAQATADLPPAEVTATSTTYDVDLPAALAVAPNYLLKRPQVVDALMAQTLSAAVTIDDAGELEVELRLPLSALAEAGDEDVEPIADEASMWAMWNLRDPGQPIDVAVPTDVAPDASCAE